MNVDDLVPLTNGLSVRCDGATLVCDRARLTRLPNDAFDVRFLIAGTDYVPALRLHQEQVANATSDDVARLIRRVTCSAVGGAPHFRP